MFRYVAGRGFFYYYSIGTRLTSLDLIGRKDTAEKGHVSTLVQFSLEMTQTTLVYSPLVRTSHMTCLTTRV